jgi:hypothetical protein
LTFFQICPIPGCNATFSYAEAFVHYGKHGVFSNDPVDLPKVQREPKDEIGMKFFRIQLKFSVSEFPCAKFKETQKKYLAAKFLRHLG